jgi:hypothetical protein
VKRWILSPHLQCDVHGADVEILTDAEQTITGGTRSYDGDECRCSEGCKGWMTADEDMFHCNWHDATQPTGGSR